MIEFTDTAFVTADYVGEPGARTFYVQAEQEGERVAALVEKQQVASIAEVLTELLSRIDQVPATDWDRDAMALREPLGDRWRAAGMAVGLDPDNGRIVLDLHEFVEDGDQNPDRAPEQLRIWLGTSQARVLASHAEEAVGQGRPRVKPETNGHGPHVR